MKTVEKEIELPLDQETVHEIRKKIMTLQSRSLSINSEIEDLLIQLTNNKVKKKITIFEEEDLNFPNSIIGWYDGQIAYTRPKTDDELSQELKIAPQEQETKIEASIPYDSLEYQEEISLEEKLDPEFEPSSLV